MRRVSATLLAAFLLAGGRAEAVTVQDIIDLSRAGLGEVVLLALIEVDGGVFAIDRQTLTSLKSAGVSDRVIEAMVRSGRNRPLEVAPPPVLHVDPPPPEVVVIERERPVIQQVVVPVPVFIPVHSRSRARAHASQPPVLPVSGFGVRHPAQERRPPKTAEPVYWGWGGKLRPDAWKPAPR